MIADSNATTHLAMDHPLQIKNASAIPEVNKMKYFFLSYVFCRSLVEVFSAKLKLALMSVCNQHNVMLIKSFEWTHVLLNSIAFNQPWILILFCFPNLSATDVEQYQSEDVATQETIRRSGWLLKPEPYFDCDVYRWSASNCDLCHTNFRFVVPETLQPLLSSKSKTAASSKTLRERLGHCYRNNWNYGLTLSDWQSADHYMLKLKKMLIFM